VSDGSFQEHFSERLSLEQVDRDIFTGLCHSGAPLRAYGGQIAAQALVAAGRTVDAPDRVVHSLHGYFLRPGRTKDSITYLVDRPRDGRSFSTRIVKAVQQGETIFMMTASFATIDDGPQHQFFPPTAPEPESVDTFRIPLTGYLGESLNAADLDYPESTIIDLRVIDAERRVELADGRYEGMAWVRISEPLADDSLTQAAALTYLSDLTLVRMSLAPHTTVRDGAKHLMLASIDHAVWFAASFRADDWLLFAQDTPVANGGHGLARGLFYTTDGQLVASVVQETLMRTARQ
jgi:acyl-CoA thioesterase II